MRGEGGRVEATSEGLELKAFPEEAAVEFYRVRREVRLCFHSVVFPGDSISWRSLVHFVSAISRHDQTAPYENGTVPYLRVGRMRANAWRHPVCGRQQRQSESPIP